MSSLVNEWVRIDTEITSYPDPRHIAIFQALNLGDLLCATPAIRAVRHRFPRAQITLIGREWARDFVTRLASIDRFRSFPGFPGIAESPASTLDEDGSTPAYDLAIQMHGSGKESNGYVASLGAPRTLGYGSAGDTRLSAVLPWVEDEPEPLRWLRLVASIGAAADNLQLDFPITAQERHAAETLLGASDKRTRIGLHVGSSTPGRRWPVESFAVLADRLMEDLDAQIILTGTATEQELTGAVSERMRSPAQDLAGRTSIGEFAAVIASLDLLVTNDTSASHIAAATRTRSVVLYGPSRPDRWAPLDLTLHQIVDATALAAAGTDGETALRAAFPRDGRLAMPAVIAGSTGDRRPRPFGAQRMRRLNVLIWHIHGSYLNSLARVDHDWYLPVKPDRPEGYGGRGRTFDMPDTMREIPAESVLDQRFDAVVLQSPRNLHEDLPELLGPERDQVAKIYLEHNAPRPHPVDTRHPFAGETGLLVHVTQYNRLMWDNGDVPTRVIEHSVAVDPAATYDGSLARGITVVNGMQARPRIAGFDLFLQAREHVPLDAAGMRTEEFGGLGDIPYRDLHRLTARYRFLFSPMRYTSLPLAVIEAMTIGMPVVALATTALPDVIQDGVNGFVSQDPETLIARMRALLDDPELARFIGERGRRTARERFGLTRFGAAWTDALHAAMAMTPSGNRQAVGAPA